MVCMCTVIFIWGDPWLAHHLHRTSAHVSYPSLTSLASDPNCLCLRAITSGTHGPQVTMARKKSWNATHQLSSVSFHNVTYNFSSQTTGQIGHMVLPGHEEAGRYEDHMNSTRSTCLCHRMKLSIPAVLHH